MQRKTNWDVECGLIFGDSVSGALFQIPFHSIDTFGISFDYGKTFEPKYFNDIYFETAGCIAGELYVSGWGLYRGIDYGNAFTYQSYHDSLALEEVGTLPGELYWIKIPLGYNPIKLAYSNDYGQTFSIREILLPGIPPMFDECDIHRGTTPGELYVVAWNGLDTIALFHSNDYGQTLTFQSYMTQTYDEIVYTAGRTPGSFYYARREICGTPPDLHSCLWIYFSRDYGVTFSTYFHNLDSLYSNVPQKEVLPDLTVFPTPANERVTFKFGGNPGNTNSRITLYDLVGKPVLEGILPEGQSEITLDTRNLSPGFYCYRVINIHTGTSSSITSGVLKASLFGKILINR
ncbi:MAG: T9SS type A sorting domain-containing protein [Bacteroidetes bacterium]|nr:T9SS type A sorting domain-containing protein [Bacteroidota bacterium]